MFLGFNPSWLPSRHVTQKNQIPRAPQAVISIEPSSTIEVFRSINCRKDFAETRCFLPLRRHRRGLPLGGSRGLRRRRWDLRKNFQVSGLEPSHLALHLVLSGSEPLNGLQ
jgi:hypothetical protein